MSKWTIQESCDVCGASRCAFRLESDGTVHRLCNDSDLQTMLESYLETALWSSTEYDEEGNMGDSLDNNYSVDDVTDDLFAESVADCESFRDCQAHLLGDVEPEAAGHNFWLSRNGHGAGFFDSNAEHADELQAATKPYGSVDLHAHEGKVHGS